MKMRIGNVDRVTCKISEHAPLDTIFCEIKTFDGEEHLAGDLKTLYFGDVRGYIKLKEDMQNEIMINFSKKQRAVCERIGKELYCRAIEHVTPP